MCLVYRQEGNCFVCLRLGGWGIRATTQPTPDHDFELQSLAALNNPFKTRPQKLTPSLNPYVPLLFYGTGV